MGIQRLQQQQGGGTDWSKYLPVSKELAITNSATQNTYVNAYSISGKGYLKQITAVQAAQGHGLKITADGVVIFESFGNSANAIGILQEEYKGQSNAGVIGIRNGQTFTNPGTAKDYPFVDSTTSLTSVICYLPQPIFFNASLLVQVRCNTASLVANVIVKGGLG